MPNKVKEISARRRPSSSRCTSVYNADLSTAALRRRVARKDGSGNVTYYFEEPAGRTRTITGANGVACNEADYYLFGGEQTHGNTCDQNYHFAGMYRDGETANDYTQFRMYESNLGRWMTPDPLAGDITNPQSLNRYAYALNNPTNLTDPLGLDPCNGIPDANDDGFTIDGCDGGGGFGGGSGGPYAGVFSTDPFDYCSYFATNDVSCSKLPGLWPNGDPIYPNLSGGRGSGGWGGGSPWPINTDYGPIGPLSLGQIFGPAGANPQCDFGPCADPNSLGEFGDAWSAKPNKQPFSTWAWDLAKDFVCGPSKKEGLDNWIIFGAEKGAIVGGLAGAIGAAAVTEGLGGPVGAVIGAAAGGVNGAIGGLVGGEIAVNICERAGLYRKK